MSKKVLITGASGFVGSGLVNVLSSNPAFSITLSSRNTASKTKCRSFVISEIGPETDWTDALKNQQVVVHVAGVAHVKNGSSLQQFHEVNVEGTLNLAAQAAQNGISRFIFISSIGVNGNVNTKPFTESDRASPVEPYAQSKWEAEKGLWDIHYSTGMELVIIRPPLVYGRGAPGNFGTLMRWIEKGVPLPFGSIYNQRSLVGLDNLVDLIITCINHPAAANQVFLAGEGQDLSTTELLQRVAKAAGKPSRLVSVPSFLLMFGAILFGRKAAAQKLLGSLQVDISKARDLLGWEPPISVEEGLERCFDSKC